MLQFRGSMQMNLFSYVLICFFCDKNTLIKSNLGEWGKGFFGLYFQSTISGSFNGVSSAFI